MTFINQLAIKDGTGTAAAVVKSDGTNNGLVVIQNSVPTTTVTGSVSVATLPSITIGTAPHDALTVSDKVTVTNSTAADLLALVSQPTAANLNATVTGTVDIATLPDINIATLPTVNVTGAVDVSTLPDITIGTMPSVTGSVNVDNLPILSKFYTHDFAAAGTGAVQDITLNPFKSYSIQCVAVGGAMTSWDVDIECSLDGTNWTAVLNHATADLDGTIKFTGAAMYPARYFRANANDITLDTATALTVNILGE